jgi:hypothetical protein
MNAQTNNFLGKLFKKKTHCPASKSFFFELSFHSPVSPKLPKITIDTFASVPALRTFPVNTVTLYRFSKVDKHSKQTDQKLENKNKTKNHFFEFQMDSRKRTNRGISTRRLRPLPTTGYTENRISSWGV